MKLLWESIFPRSSTFSVRKGPLDWKHNTKTFFSPKKSAATYGEKGG
jgi:hypothetical protein